LTGERVVRRLAAILAADVVGYSRLMGRDENGTLARLKAHRTERLEQVAVVGCCPYHSLEKSRGVRN
jgi:class 3 adenylate cyclase